MAAGVANGVPLNTGIVQRSGAPALDTPAPIGTPPIPIGDTTAFIAGVFGFNDCLNWSDGAAPDASNNGLCYEIAMPGINNGFSLTLPGTATAATFNTVSVWTASYCSQTQLVVHAADGTFVDTTDPFAFVDTNVGFGTTYVYHVRYVTNTTGAAKAKLSFTNQNVTECAGNFGSIAFRAELLTPGAVVNIPTSGTAPTPMPSPTIWPAANPTPTGTIVLNETPKRAFDFIDSIGVNTHNGFAYGGFGQFYPYSLNAQIITLLQGLHITHIRDEVFPTGYANAVTNTSFQNLVNNNLEIDDIVPANFTAAQVNSLQGLTGNDIEQFEPANEPDNATNADWIAQTTAQQIKLQSLAHAMSPSIPVLGPALVHSFQDYVYLGNISAYTDFGNVHDYFYPNWPEENATCDGGTAFIIFGGPFASCVTRQSTLTVGGQQLQSTEAGYNGVFPMPTPTPSSPIYTDDVTQLRYVPRQLFTHFNAGIKRSYVYELLDASDPTSGGSLCLYCEFGLVAVTGNPPSGIGAPKPAYKALSALLGYLNDANTAFTPAALSYTLSGTTADVYHTLLQKSDGTYWAAFWLGKQSVSTAAGGGDIAVTPQTVTITTTPTFPTANYYTSDETGTYTSAGVTGWTGTTGTISVSDKVSLVQLSTAAAPVNMVFEVQPPVISNGTGVNTSVNPSLGSPATAGSKLILSIAGGVSCSPTITGITGWTQSFCDTSGTPTQATWYKTASGGDQTVHVTLNGSGNPSQAILVELGNASAAAPTFASAIETWSYAAKTVPGPTVASAAAGSYALGGWTFTGLSGSYVPGSGFFQVAAPWAPANENVTTQTINSQPQTSLYVWGHVLNPPAGTIGTTFYGPSILNTVYSKGATPHVVSETIVVAPAGGLVTPLPTPTPSAVAAGRSDNFVGTMGVNLHLAYNPSVYSKYLTTPAPNGNTVITSLANLGVRHVRDNEDYGSNPACSTYTTLFGLGIDVDVTTDTSSTAANWTTAYNCVTNTGANPTAMFSFEGWNEYNAPGDGTYTHGAGWASALYQNQINLYTARSSTSKILAPPIIDATNHNDLSTLAGLYPGTFSTPLSAYVNAANMHLDNNGSNNPDSLGNISPATCYGNAGSMQNEFNWQSIIVGGACASPAKPVYITEFGWADTSPVNASYIDNSTKAKYVLRGYLQAYLEGVAGTYLYELARENTTDYYSIMDDYLNPAPPYTAIENLVNILEDSACAPSCSFATTPLVYSVANTQPDFEQLLLEKQDGSYWLVLWRSSEGYDYTSNSSTSGHTATNIPIDSVILTFGTSPSALKLYSWVSSTGAVTKSFPTANKTITLSVTDTPQVLEIIPTGVTPAVPVLATPQPPVCPAAPNVLNCSGT